MYIWSTIYIYRYIHIIWCTLSSHVWGFGSVPALFEVLSVWSAKPWANGRWYDASPYFNLPLAICKRFPKCVEGGHLLSFRLLSTLGQKALCGYTYIYIYMCIHVHYIYIFTYIYDIFIYNTFTKYTYLYRYTIKHIDRYNRFIQMHREIKSNVHLAMAPSNENKPGSCEHGQGACPATWQSFQGHCALATIFSWMLGTDNDWDIYGYPMENWMMFRGFRFKPRLGLSKQFSDVTWYNMV